MRHKVAELPNQHFNMRLIYITYLVILLCNSNIFNLHAQNVWPGDANNNGIVDGVDFLYISTAYRATGEERNSSTTDWVPQALPSLWSGSFPNGLNYAYADADGNGEIDEDDLEVVEDNYGETHGTVVPDVYSNGIAGMNPQVKLEIQSSDVKFGDEVEVKIIMGDSNLPFNDFYGVNMKISYDTEITDDDEEWEFEFEDNNWLDPTNSFKLEHLVVNDESTGTAEIAFALNNQTPVTGFGEVGSFFIIIEDYVVGRAELDTIQIVIDSIFTINENLITSMTVPDTISFEVSRESTNSTSIANEKDFSVFPNPASNSTKIRFSRNLEVETVTMKNTIGIDIPIFVTYSNLREVLVSWESSIPAGMYFISLQTEKNLFTKPLQINIH